MFSPKDLSQFAASGIAPETVQQQLENFRQGFPFLQTQKAATVGEGILRLDEYQLDHYIQAYEKALPHKKVVKFVPASGAASRMFKDLFEALNAPYKPISAKVQPLFDRLADFAFSADLAAVLGKDLAQASPMEILAGILHENGLNYGALPKGLLKFHRYPTGARTPLEEHMVEGANYCAGDKGRVPLHLTVSPEHKSKFAERVAEVQAALESQFNVRFDISFSEQKPSTDTLAVDMDNQPFREDDGSILFRPGGHGALLENLNDIDGDVIFIKNIDNVVPDRIKRETYRYKKAIAGILLEYQTRIFAYLDQLDRGTNTPLLKEISRFLREELCLQFDPGDRTEAELAEFLYTKLSRPIRVCGMVKNEGEPGGGPYWAVNADNTVSLQIAESAQIDMDDAAQVSIMQGATHFNPVDLVCGTKDRHGKSFDLLQFRDPQTGFIAYKSKDGRDLKAQELPGLWNGAMADWNTLFVEVPILTFNPVKTVMDLLRPEHQ